MRLPDRSAAKPARALGLFLICLAASPALAAERPLPDDHGAAMAALRDIQAAQQTVVSAEDSFATDPGAYRAADQRAINALVGSGSADFVPAAGTPGDAEGALGHLQHLLDRAGTPPWVAPLHGVEANLNAAVARLQEAKAARELMAHEITVSAALENLLAAVGRPSQPGVFGGMQGALGTTVLGVPAGARQVDACAPPQAGPAFGTHAGWLAFVSLPLRPGHYALPVTLGTAEVEEQGSVVVLKTPAAARVAELCRSSAAAQPDAADPAVRPVSDDASAGFNQPAGAAPAPQPEVGPPADQTDDAAAGFNQPAGGASASQPAAGPPADLTDDAAAGFNQPPKSAARRAAAPSGQVPALYTEAQAHAGAQVYQSQCVSCHGANLQGVAAPGVAGKEFLGTAERNDWTLEVIRTLVFENMPFNNPGSLTPQQYADVMAFLLASNCYPAGSRPFPESNQPSFAKIQLRPPPSPVQGAAPSGVCPVK